MVGIIWFALFLCCGEFAAFRLFRDHPTVIRAWMGGVLGCVLAMWLPTICAFAMRFTVACQWVALGLAVGIAAAARFVPKRTALPLPQKDDAPPLAALLAVTLPLLIIGAYLQFTHNMRMEDGAYWVGQSTYSDINLHLSIVTGVRNAQFPPEYVILPGTRLCYPFLTDTLSGSMFLLGTEMGASLYLPGIVMMALTFTGYACLAWKITRNRSLMVLSVLLLFVNGGFGFLKMWDMLVKDPSLFRNIFDGYYQTPTNLPDFNLRWSNILVDLLVPQRTFLAGWTVLMSAMYLVLDAIQNEKRRSFLLAGVIGGCMPMVNTHAFVALGLASAGFMAYLAIDMTREIKAADAKGALLLKRKSMMLNFVLYGAIAVGLALPQILIWTIHQATEGGFVKLHFNWVNNENGSLIDEYFWFWIKNIGPAALFMIPALLDSQKEQRMLAVGAFTIFAVAELIVFQPLVYDNNKLYYIWYMLFLPVVLRYVQRLGEGMKKMGLRGRGLLAALFVFCSLFSGTLTIGREMISNYQLYGANEVTAMEFVEENTPQDAVFLAGGQHNNAVSTLTGRKLVCGSDTFLYFHGLNYWEQKDAAQRMFTDPDCNEALFTEYAVDYIYISAWERSQFAIDEAYFAEHFPLIYELGDIRIYAVSERARALLG